MRFIKIFFGIVLCTCAFGFTVATEQVDPGMQPFFIVLVALCVLGAVLLLRKSKKDKAKAAQRKKPPVVSQGEFVTVQTEYIPSEVPTDVAADMRKYYTAMQAQRDVEIMLESRHLARTTKNIDTFCMRYDLALRKAHTLLQAEEVGVRGVKKLNYHNICTEVIEEMPTLKGRALHDYAAEEIYKAEGLKTDKGKCNRYIKMLEALVKAEPTFMFMDEYDALIAKVKERITELGGTVPNQ